MLKSEQENWLVKAVRRQKIGEQEGWEFTLPGGEGFGWVSDDMPPDMAEAFLMKCLAKEEVYRNRHLTRAQLRRLMRRRS